MDPEADRLVHTEEEQRELEAELERLNSRRELLLRVFGDESLLSLEDRLAEIKQRLEAPR